MIKVRLRHFWSKVINRLWRPPENEHCGTHKSCTERPQRQIVSQGTTWNDPSFDTWRLSIEDDREAEHIRLRRSNVTNLNRFNQTLRTKGNHRGLFEAIEDATVEDSGPVVIVLDEMLGTAAAAPLRDRLLAAKGCDLTLDVSKVRHLGGLCAQVLLATAATWRAAGRNFALSGTNESFLGAVQTLGLSNHLSCEA